MSMPAARRWIGSSLSSSTVGLAARPFFRACSFNFRAFLALRREAGELEAILISFECCDCGNEDATAVRPSGLELTIFQTGSPSETTPDGVTNAFIGKPKEPCSLTGKKPAPLNSGP